MCIRDRAVVRVAPRLEADLAGELQRIEGRPNLGIVVEVHVDVACRRTGRGAVQDAPGVGGLTAATPGLDAVGPPRELLLGVAARVELPGAVQAQVDEVG